MTDSRRSAAPVPTEVAVFGTAEEFRDWLTANHDAATELWVGYYKKGVPKTSMTYKESVDLGLCFGWIDGLTRRIDDEVYAIRFTPRTKRSTWSAVNVARMGELMAAGRAASCGHPRVRGAHRRQHWHLLLRESSRRPAGRVPVATQSERGRMGLVAGADAELSKGGDLVGRFGQTGGDPRSAPGDPDRRLRGGTHDQVAAVWSDEEARPMIDATWGLSGSRQVTCRASRLAAR